jgi:hypothetical protein
VTSLSYRDADGVRHELAVRETAGGDWQVLDTCAAETRVIETLDGRVDGRPQADALARDYLETARLSVSRAGRAASKPIPERGGSDADSDRRPRPGPRQPHARRAALPHPAG